MRWCSCVSSLFFFSLHTISGGQHLKCIDKCCINYECDISKAWLALSTHTQKQIDACPVNDQSTVHTYVSWWNVRMIGLCCWTNRNWIESLQNLLNMNDDNKSFLAFIVVNRHALPYLFMCKFTSRYLLLPLLHDQKVEIREIDEMRQ